MPSAPTFLSGQSQSGLSYFLFGNRRNPVIIFLHGFLGSARDWFSVAEILSKNYCCLLVDLPGHGESRDLPKSGYTMPVCAENIIHLLKELRIHTTHLVGYSMGGRLGFYLAAHYQKFFDKIVLESASPGLQTDAEKQQRIKQDAEIAQKLESLPFQDFLDYWYTLPLFGSLRKHERLGHLKKVRQTVYTEGLIFSLRKMGTGVMPNLWPELHNITNPVLLLTGDLDKKFENINREINEKLPDGRHQIIRAAGHNLHFEQQKIFIEILISFFKKEGKNERN
ncbi:MAG: 2-succinyl-6-hydroxy-2,4-cyclohexadiene-1-carboxylate synthase [Calditrichaeota bacterium]|nr:MAG: 2-succinyl-6-hydroxy-2,4-cyclohexadiene-1-carboxylate synthase [Calditrichota bacterium]